MPNRTIRPVKKQKIVKSDDSKDSKSKSATVDKLYKGKHEVVKIPVDKSLHKMPKPKMSRKR